ncbi:HNH endonuclease [Allochromatium humboldtianum]|uniref:HNH endonuclease n=1 Tax=Allochromatium humboldtianum TaxID=504901 RepID=A0A850RBZ4_9GAMM|nr:RNA-guided endonuclease IscB [Allochromatium humboldtianum]NVZ11544.1 HNH endonuclease [Allochromatium humboldtianum]
MNNRVFVLSSTKKPLMPCTPARARKLLHAGRAAIYRRQPFTIILLERAAGDTQPIEVKLDPGSKTTGIALVADFLCGRTVIWAANLHHRGQAIRSALTDRRAFRRGRRARKTRYRAPRFLNRTRLAGWLPPSLRARVDNVRHLTTKLQARAPIASAAVETVRFDTQALQNPEISGVEYQQGELAGYEVREYLLEKWNRTCAYCGARDVPLEVEHIVPRSRGGSDRVSNLTLACRPCNERKGSQPIEEFLKGKPEVLRRIQAQARTPLKDAAAVNATRYAIGEAVKSVGLPTTFWSGGRTKKNRVTQGYVKDHWIDAACVGESGAAVRIASGMQALTIKATGRGRRRVQGNDRFGFPRGTPRSAKRVHGFQTGDLAKLTCTTGKSAGVHVGRIAAIRARGWFVLNKHDRPAREFRLLQRADGYDYTNDQPSPS